MKDSFSRELEIFASVVKLGNAEVLEAYLKEACAGDAELRQRVEALLKAHLDAGTFLQNSPAGARTILVSPLPGPNTVAAALTEQAGDRIGRYKLLQKIGEGGCGVVYMAEQEEPVRRRVALKVIKLGMDTKSVIARFEAERQALALMDHPNIAKVLDAGATDAGRPYFVMELVRGVRITDYCDEAKLSTRERLDLFIQVCQAIQHAHQKGIIHRDIKPSNILVTVNDGVPVPKVIDFGIAKATNQQQLTDKTLFTAFEQFIGTPAYMSPEQAVMTSLDIDTRSDIYALGVLLYELLTGKTPFDPKELMQAGLDEIRRTIREVEPPRPSTCLSTMIGADLTNVAKLRHSEPAKLATLIRGDLDWIVMKALEKDRTRRYETANGLAADVRRHLSNEPVIARPPSTAYRFQKMVRRNRTVAVATFAIAGTLIAALGFSTAAFLSERKARLQAAAAERARAEAGRFANAETVRADEVVRFINGFFNLVIPELTQRGHYDAIKALLGVTDQIASHLSNAPLTQAEIRLNIGKGYADILNDFSMSMPQLTKAENLSRLVGERGRHLAELARANGLAVAMWNDRDTNAANALRRLSKEALDRTPPDTQVAAGALATMSWFYSYFGDAREAETVAREALRVAPDDAAHRDSRLIALDVLAGELANRGAFVEEDQVGTQLYTMLPQLRTKSLEGRNDFPLFDRLISSEGQFDPSEMVLRRSLECLPSEDTTLRYLVAAQLGNALAKSGNWKTGLDLIIPCITNSVGTVQLWSCATQLAALIENDDLHRSLCIFGLARFAGGADSETGRIIADALLMLPPDSSMLPIIRDLVNRSLQGAPWTRVWSQIELALLNYRTGRFTEAAIDIEKYMRDQKAMGMKGTDGVLALGHFVRSMIETKLNHLNRASEAYTEGLRSHSTALRGPGTRYTGVDWGGARGAELVRREAAALLGDATPTDSDREHEQQPASKR